MKKVVGLYYLCSENKGADQCVFVFAYAKIRFSHNKAQIMMYLIAFEFIIMNISNNYGFMVLTQFWHNQNFYTYSADLV